MRKEVLLLSIVFLILLVPFVLADDEIDLTTLDDSSKIDRAEQCLDDLIEDRGCDDLSSKEKIFALLTAGKCRSDVNDDAKNDECWPKSGCEIKTTAQAILALKGDSKAEDWLSEQNTTPTDLEWFLEIESANPTECEISYPGVDTIINIGEDKKIDRRAGECLSLSSNDYWLKVNSDCYDLEFEISCDETFLTTLLFKQKRSSTIHVSGEVSSASAEGITREEISTLCFGLTTSCDYEGSLWAAMVLASEGHDVDAFIPYLIAMSDEDENEKYLPDSFLYYLIGSSDFRTSVLEEQKANNYWEVSGNKFFDTALALLAFQGEEPQEKIDAKDWLLGVQDSEGCWQSSVVDTSFILYSIWGKGSSGGGGNGDDDDCEDSGYHCLRSSECDNANGDIKDEYVGCFGADVCCSNPAPLQSCFDLSGEVCVSGKECSISTQEASDTPECCTGTCESVSQDSECEINSGTCRSGDCNSDEEISSYECDSVSDWCCKAKEPSPSYWGVWVLIILIVLVVLAIMYKDQLRKYLLRFKSGGKKPGPPGPGDFGFPMTPSSRQPRRRAPRRIFPASQKPRPRRAAPRKKPTGDFEDVLKKLKDMGS